jgi:PEP-CTERM motif-containing protein
MNRSRCWIGVAVSWVFAIMLAAAPRTEAVAIDVPGSQPGSTVVRGENSRGDLVGTYCLAERPCSPFGITHDNTTFDIRQGFLFKSNTYTTFAFPGGLLLPNDTIATDVNALDQIVGYWKGGLQAEPVFEGFEFDAVTGTFFQLPNPNRSAHGCQGETDVRPTEIDNNGNITGILGIGAITAPGFPGQCYPAPFGHAAGYFLIHGPSGTYYSNDPQLQPFFDPIPAAFIPQPASLALLGLGMLLVLTWRTRRCDGRA